ncbi:hypothetical protein H2198_001187 [Neophaeococcomyces mojaviensis]|uniref:Uncharacterized protein n=1 Tax=Neophaeococcomyces mojaviensis TaxID=3383035 RepID=A0ACC3AHL3_9EURO|nr:hypothetical protein H2198_001187 [Knufia sp. JES_112]
MAFFVSEKIKRRKEDKREAKRIAYEKRYEELEAEHKRNKLASSAGLEKTTALEDHQPNTVQRNDASRSSHDSQRDADANNDSTHWAEETNLVRLKSQSELSSSRHKG